MKTQILVEELLPHESNLTMLESANADKTMYLLGTALQADIRNRNNRIYPLNEIATACATLSKQIKENNGVLGENGHPDSLQIDMMRASHVITEVFMDGLNCKGKFRLLNTPPGLVAQEVYKAGVRPAVSSRGAGTVHESGLVEGFLIITIDLVTVCSAPNATPNVVYEALQHNKIMTLAEQLQHDDDAQKYFTKEIKKFLTEIVNKK